MKFLVPLDGSKLSKKILPWVRYLANEEDEVELTRSFPTLAQLHLSTVLTHTVAELVNECDLQEQLAEELKTSANKLPGLKISTSCIAGSPAVNILERSEEKDLILMSSHGQSGFTKWLIGSVAIKVLRASLTPVLIVNEALSKTRAEPKLQRIMVPLDGSLRAEKALPMAISLAQRTGASLLLYQSVTQAWRISAEDKRELEAAEVYLEKKAEEITGIECDTLAKETAGYAEIEEEAESHDIDLIVMGSHGRSGVQRWVLGSVTESVLQRSRCPVLVVYNRPL